MDRENWYAARRMAVALRETVHMALDPSSNEASSADHQRLEDYADELLSAVEKGDPETVAMLLRRAPR